jgi:hypothetical protein
MACYAVDAVQAQLKRTPYGEALSAIDTLLPHMQNAGRRRGKAPCRRRRNRGFVRSAAGEGAEVHVNFCFKAINRNDCTILQPEQNKNILVLRMV